MYVPDTPANPVPAPATVWHGRRQLSNFSNWPHQALEGSPFHKLFSELTNLELVRPILRQNFCGPDACSILTSACSTSLTLGAYANSRCTSPKPTTFACSRFCSDGDVLTQFSITKGIPNWRRSLISRNWCSSDFQCSCSARNQGNPTQNETTPFVEWCDFHIWIGLSETYNQNKAPQKFWSVCSCT